jgi:hypothetical protein
MQLQTCLISLQIKQQHQTNTKIGIIVHMVVMKLISLYKLIVLEELSKMVIAEVIVTY